MSEIGWTDLLDGRFAGTPAAVTIGVFDGVHRGHQELISRVTGHSGTMAVVLTFTRHPTELLAPDRFPGLIMSRRQKVRTLETAGADLVVEINFDRGFSSLTGEEFLGALLESFDLRSLAVGYDFRCGRDMGMDGVAVRDWLRDRGVRVELVDAVSEGEGIVSSTRIREHIRRGELERACLLLGRPWELDVSETPVSTADETRVYKVGRDGFLPPHRQLLPAPGAYHARVHGEDHVAETIAGIDGNSVSLPLAVCTGIRYIVLQEHGFR